MKVVTRTLGVLSIAALGVLLICALFLTKSDAIQGDYARLIYIHPAVAWASYVALGICALASALYLLPRTRSMFWDSLAGAAGEVGTMFCALALITGAIWGRPVWGVWWTWDARLTSTALLFVLFLGYLALRKSGGLGEVRAKRSAIAALIAIIDVPIVHFSVEWWRTLHQGRTLLRPDPTIHGLSLFTMLWSFVALTLTLSWILIHRFRVERLERTMQVEELDRAIVKRRNDSLVAQSTKTGVTQ